MNNDFFDLVRMQHDSQYDIDSDVLLAPPELKRPSQYAVILLNDDYTPMEFVIEVLQQFFNKDIDQATQIMLTVHYQGRAVAGLYSKDIASTKANQVNDFSRKNGHPLMCTVEEQPE
ncbi:MULTISPECIES: ATP-dependent Clp protease adapter ClpS [unclassified Acinetobacter]|uniref:ATP-dependent Clp protease adapter ClpS n=1 Tax=unclassified Acinetobacter TaxID=196816 RepID=UPI0035B9CCCC